MEGGREGGREGGKEGGGKERGGQGKGEGLFTVLAHRTPISLTHPCPQTSAVKCESTIR